MSRCPKITLRGLPSTAADGTDSRAATTADLTDGRAGYHPCASVRAWRADPAHSQGGNNVIEMARLLEREKIRVDLLITLAPFGQDPFPGNVVRATNYYHSPGWGMPLAADAGYRGKLSNINLGGDSGISHIAIDKSPKIQAEIERAIMAVSQTR
jgi:hypothetical protein